MEENKLNYDTNFENMLNRLKEKRALDISIVEKAYALAKKLHEGQTRKGGAPYISHPVEVSSILERMDFDTNVIASALLHDVVEDCEYTIEDVEENFNKSVAKIVDAVTAIEIKLEEGEDQSQAKMLEDLKAYQKLIAIGKENLYAFYIKFGDRLHNLQTIESFPRYKQMEKVRDTENWLVPVMKILQANEFLIKISNECFKIQHFESLKSYQLTYDKYFDYNEIAFERLKNNLSLHLNKYVTKKKANLEISNVKIVPFTEHETFSAIKDVMNVKTIKEIKQSFLNKFAVTKIFVVFKNKLDEKVLRNFVINFLIDDTTKKIIKINGYGFDEMSGSPYILVSDNARNKFQLFIFNTKSYLVFRNGTTAGVDLSYMDEGDSGVSDKYIQIRTKSGEIISLPDNSTVLDFAFRIHKDFGFACKHAYLNDSPMKSPIHARLSDGDKVDLAIEKDESGNCKNIAQIRWIMYAKTENAQRALVRYFENKI